MIFYIFYDVWKLSAGFFCGGGTWGISPEFLDGGYRAEWFFVHDYHPWARGSLALQHIKIKEREFIVFYIASLINKKNHVAYSLRATTADAKTQTTDVFILNILKSGVSRIDCTFFISFRNPLMQRKKFLQFLGCKGVVVLDFQTKFCANRIT